MKYLLILVFSIISISSCKQKKNVQATTKVEKVEKVESNEEISDKKAETDRPSLEDLSPEELRDYELAQADFSDSLIAQIRRTPCFGHCPTYILNVYKSGYLEYEGKRNVENIGMFSSYVNEEFIEQLLKKAEEIGFFEMNYFYDNPNVTDLPSTITSIRNDSEMKTILSRFNAPTELMAFNKYFDSLFKDIEWKKIED